MFLLWALRGVSSVPDRYWIPICLALFLVPTGILHLATTRAIRSGNTQTIKVLNAKDQREHLLTYLFAMLIPLFDVNLGGFRDLLAVAVAFLFVLFLFWHMRLHYMNLYFAFQGYRIYTAEVELSTTAKERSGKTFTTYALLSKRSHIPDGEVLTGTRLGGGVLLDRDAND